MDVDCYRRRLLPGIHHVTQNFNPVILIYVDANVGQNVYCYIPEVFMPTAAGNYILKFHIQYPDLYTDYIGPSYLNPWVEDASPFVATAAPSAFYPTTLNAATAFIQDPAGFYQQRFVGQEFNGYYELIVQQTYKPGTTSGGVAFPYVYWRPAFIGPVPTDEFCDHTDWIFNPIQNFPPTRRIYNQVSPVVICQRVHAPTENSRFRSGATNYMIPGKPYDITAPTYYYQFDVNVYENKNWAYTGKKSIDKN